jgi:apolipoprotein N-acyltransferase
MAKSFLYKWTPLLLSLSGALLLWASWPTSPLTFLIFIAFIPFLWLADLALKRSTYIYSVLLMLLIWNVATTWWVGNTTLPASGVAANLINTLLMGVPLMAYRRTRRRLGEVQGYLSLIVYWLTFEYIHQSWEFSWPWLNLGNVFAMHPNWVQWYEYTGVSGGTAWVWLVNISIYHTWKQRKEFAYPWRNAWKPALLIIAPLLLSSLIFFRFQLPKGRATQVIVVQPNVDPYDKFAEENTRAELDTLLALSQRGINKQTDYILWPETALFPNGTWEHNMTYESEMGPIRQLLHQYPNASIVTGAVTFKRYSVDAPLGSRRSEDGTVAYDVFNSALQIDTSLGVQVYHKAKLVPGAELVPYARYLTFMSALALDFGGVSGSYGVTPGVQTLDNNSKHIKIVPTICYESVFGDFIAEHVNIGGNLLFIMTNDGWWGNTEGHRQHLQYARLRAIETRRWVARSANTGISAIIDPAGKIIQSLPYWQPGIIKGNVTPNDQLTFYVQYGDLISKAAIAFCILLIVYSFYIRFKNKRTGITENYE